MTARRLRRVGARVALVLVGLEIGLRLAGAVWDSFAGRRAARGDGDLVAVCVGDSHTEGLDGGPGGSYPDHLARLLGARVVNLGRSGSNSTHHLAALREGLARHAPDAALILTGNNDHWNIEGVSVSDEPAWRRRARGLLWELRTVRLALQAVGRAPWRREAILGAEDVVPGALSRAAHRKLLETHLRTMIREARAAGAVPVVGTYFHRHGWGVNEAIREIARDEGVEVADHERRFAALPIDVQGRLLVPDGHPNSDGYRLMAEEWAAALERAGVVGVE